MKAFTHKFLEVLFKKFDSKYELKHDCENPNLIDSVIE